MRKIIYKTSIFLVCLLIFSTCSILQQAKTLSNCTFDFAGVKHFKIANVSLYKINNINDINLSDATQILTALSKKKTDLSFDVIIKGNNPNKKAASIDKLEYIILLENQEIISGELNEKFIIPAYGSSLISINANIDALKILNVKTLKNVYVLYQNISGNNSEKKSKISIKIKPTINNYSFPSFITINKQI